MIEPLPPCYTDDAHASSDPVIGSLCKCSEESVTVAFEQLFDQLNTDHSQVRLSAFQVPLPPMPCKVGPFLYSILHRFSHSPARRLPIRAT